MVLDSEDTQSHQRIGAEIEASPYFVECGRLFTDDNLRTPSFQRQRRRKPADAAADNGNAWHAPHASRSVCRRWMQHSGKRRTLCTEHRTSQT